MTDFDLRAAVIVVLDTTPLTEPADIATKVAKNVPAKQLRAALTAALVSYVATVNQQRRMDNPLLGGSQSGRSSKVAGIADWWTAAMRDRVHVDGGQKMLGDCTFADLMFAAAERRQQARWNEAKADQYEALAKKLREHDVECVSGLPRSAVDEWGNAA
jgi:hypothetical protein